MSVFEIAKNHKCSEGKKEYKILQLNIRLFEELYFKILRERVEHNICGNKDINNN